MTASTTPRPLPLFRFVIIAGFLLLSVAGPLGLRAAGAPQRETGVSEGAVSSANTRLTYRLFQEVLSAGYDTQSAALIADGAVLVTPAGEFAGPAGFDVFLDSLRAPFTTIRFEINDVLEHGDTVAVRWTMSGRVGMSSAPVVIEGTSLVQIESQLIIRHDVQYDRADLDRQVEQARYTEMEVARHVPAGQRTALAGDPLYPPPVAGVQEAPTQRPLNLPSAPAPE